MTRLSWNTSGNRYYEAGVDRAVLFVDDAPGVPWNGLISVNDSPQGGEVTPFYIDGVKYLQVPLIEEFSGSISAYTYPDEFLVCEGVGEYGEGLFVSQQKRKEFALSYRTGLGNDLAGLDHGYKIHIVYNALIVPSEKSYSTRSTMIDPNEFSWSFSTRPALVGEGFSLSAHAVVDSTKTEPELLAEVETALYGTETREPKLLSFAELVLLFKEWYTPLQVNPNEETGLADLTIDGLADLQGKLDVGIYKRPRQSRLLDVDSDGFYTLEE